MANRTPHSNMRRCIHCKSRVIAWKYEYLSDNQLAYVFYCEPCASVRGYRVLGRRLLVVDILEEVRS